MDKEFERVIAEMKAANEHALLAICETLADVTGHERLAKMLEFHAAKLQHAAPHPRPEWLLEAIVDELRERA